MVGFKRALYSSNKATLCVDPTKGVTERWQKDEWRGIVTVGAGDSKWNKSKS